MLSQNYTLLYLDPEWKQQQLSGPLIIGAFNERAPGISNKGSQGIAVNLTLVLLTVVYSGSEMC